MMDRKQEIIETARSVVSLYGIKKVTIDDVARKAHISKATIYRFFHNKGDILDELVTTEAEGLLEAVRMAADAEASSRAKLKAHLLVRMKRISELLEFYRVSEETWGDFWPYLIKLKEWFVDAETEIIKGILKCGIDRGEVHIGRLDVCAHITCATLHTIELPWALQAHGIDARQYADTIVEMLYDGIRER